MTRALALLPAALLALGAFWSGGFATAASFPNGPVGLLALLALTPFAARSLPDPLRLGRWGALWAPALVGLVAIAANRSPIPRAGFVALVLLPAFLLLPAAVARLWRDDETRRLGVAAWGAVVIAVAVAAIVDSAGGGWRRAAAPLGHHNLLAAWLAIAVPVAAAGLRRRGWAGALALAATVAGTGALAATRSLGGLVALGVVGVAASYALERGRDLVLGLALLALGLAVPRIDAVVRGHDPSYAARTAYAAAALEGASERPWFGWGPGAAPWTLAGFLEPRPGANPPGELVGEPHSTPLRLAFELGLPGLLLALGLLVHLLVARWRARRDAEDRSLLLAGVASVAAGALAAVSGSWLAVPALPTAWALAAGAALAGSAEGHRSRPLAGALATGLYGVLAAWALVPLFLAQRDYGRAIGERDAHGKVAALEAAIARDPEFPLYGARRAWLLAGDPQTAARSAVEAARGALGVAPLWLRAGALALEAESPALARPALERALALDPLSGGPPFALYVALGGKDSGCAARALAAEPVLAAATFWRGREDERAEAIARVRAWPGLDAGWRSAFAEQATRAKPGNGEPRDFVYRIDGSPALSASLHLFRRAPWPAELLRIRVDADAARRIELPAATEMASSSPAAFPARRCAPH